MERDEGKTFLFLLQARSDLMWPEPDCQSDLPPFAHCLPQELSYETVEVDKIYILTNALLIAENELIFLAIASILKDRKAVLLGGAGYVYFGRINARLVFLLIARGESFAVIQASKSLKPKAGIFLGFGKCPHSRT